MNLYSFLRRRGESGKPLRVALIGAGKFGSMFLSRVRRTPGLHVVAVALSVSARAKASLASVAGSAFRGALTRRSAHVRQDVHHRRARRNRFRCGRDRDRRDRKSRAVSATRLRAASTASTSVVKRRSRTLAGPLLARRAMRPDRVFARLRRPACVDLRDGGRARAAGFRGGRRRKRHEIPAAYHESTPIRLGPLRLYAGDGRGRDFNPQMFNSFLDGTKSAIEMAAVANATGSPPPAGRVSAVQRRRVPALLKPRSPRRAAGCGAGGGRFGLNRDGSEIPRNLRWGFTSLSPPTANNRRCFHEYGLVTIRRQLFPRVQAVSMDWARAWDQCAWWGFAASNGLAIGFHADACDRQAQSQGGDTLDGEGGLHRLRKADAGCRICSMRGLPIGLAHGREVTRPVAKNEL